MCGLLDCINNPFGHGLVNHNFNLHFRQKIDYIFGAAIKFGMAFLATKSLCFQDGDALNADVVKRFLDLIELERLDDGFDFLMAFVLCSGLQAGLSRGHARPSGNPM